LISSSGGLVRGQNAKQLAPSQRQALRQMLGNSLVVITGSPGVGKTTLSHPLLTIARAKKIRCFLTAPTGRAAKRLNEATGLEAKTIHRLLEVQPGSGRFARGDHNPLECDLLVIEETSMVDVPLMSDPREAISVGARLCGQAPLRKSAAWLRDVLSVFVLYMLTLVSIRFRARGPCSASTINAIQGCQNGTA
jgi:hypothetical protein